jgi:hypothetical protein
MSLTFAMRRECTTNNGGQTSLDCLPSSGTFVATLGVLVSNFCIPPTGSLALDGLANLPGPGSVSLPGNAQFFSPSGAFIAE